MSALNKVNGLEWTEADLQKKFSETWIVANLVSGNPKKIIFNGPVQIRACGWGDEDGGTGACVRWFEGPKVNEMGLPYKNILVVDDRPDPCITNVSTYACLFAYNPARQWKRGFGHHNCFLYMPINGAPSLQASSSYWSAEAVNKIVTPDHMPIDMAMEWFKANPKGSGRAINNRYWLLRDGETIKLYRHKAFMGSFIGRKFFANAGVEIFKEELRAEVPFLREAYGYH